MFSQVYRITDIESRGTGTVVTMRPLVAWLDHSLRTPILRLLEARKIKERKQQPHATARLYIGGNRHFQSSSPRCSLG